VQFESLLEVGLFPEAFGLHQAMVFLLLTLESHLAKVSANQLEFVFLEQAFGWFLQESLGLYPAQVSQQLFVWCLQEV